MRRLFLFFMIFTCPLCELMAQKHIKLDLATTIAIANDSSLEAFRAQNMYLSSYWEYRSYKANRLPSLTLNLTPVQYNRDITRRYDSQQDLDVYRTQQSYYASGSLAIQQNFDLTGGTFYLQSDLGYMRNFGSNSLTQFTTVPLRLGYTQELVGYNEFKWQRRIEPLKYEQAKKQFIYNVEQISETATSYFFTLALAQAEYELAKSELASKDTLCRIAEERYKIAAISKAELLTLRLDLVNARTTLETQTSALKRAMFSLASFLNMDENTVIELELPTRPRELYIPIDKALACSRENNPELLQLKLNVLNAKQNVDRTKKESHLDATLNASIGFNQVAERFSEAYRHPLQQDLVSVSLSIPLLDWGVRKGRYNMARNALNVEEISAKQSEISIEEELIMTINDFHIQQQLIKNAETALDLAIMAYEETKSRFMIGQTDINSLTLAQSRQQSAQQNYISALQNYWQSYYKIRRMTLFDFRTGISLGDRFDLNGGYLVR